MTRRRFRAALLVLPLFAVASGVATGPAYLVKDINHSRETIHSGLREAVVFDGALHFVAYDEANGFQIWRSDGTEGGTRMVESIERTGGYMPRCLTPYRGELHFLWGGGIWKIASESGRLAPVSRSLEAACPVPFRGELFFAAYDAQSGHELWKTDGTEEGTVLVADLNPGPGSSYPHLVTAIGENLYFFTLFLASPTEQRWALWKSDGTAEGTVRLHEFVGSYFEGPQPMVIPFGPYDLTELNGIAYFLANDGVLGLELWRTDGTAAGTHVVRDIHFGTGGAFNSPEALEVVNGTLYFFARDGIHGFELWKSDGTASGTALVADLAPGPANSGPGAIGGAGTGLYFTTREANVGVKLWRSDGTSAGTSLVSDFGARVSGPWILTDFEGMLYFVLDNRTAGFELWKSDGTSSGTALVADLLPGREGSNPSSFVEFDGSLFFTANDARGAALWRIDAPGDPPRRVRGIHSSQGSSRPLPLLAVSETLLFAAAEGKEGPYAFGVWRSDGTAESTLRLTRPKVRVNTALVAAGGTTFFGADDGLHGWELWKTDGTVAGTHLFKDIYPGRRDSSPASLISAGDRLFFTAWSDQGWQLWTSDGTLTGTVPISSAQPAYDYGSGRLRSAVALGNELFFLDGAGALWKSDGTPGGTRLIRSVGASAAWLGLARVGQSLFFFQGTTLWKSDGTETGTVALRDLGARITEFAAGGNVLYVAVGGDSEPLSQLWRSDGTTEGTTLVRDFTSSSRWGPPHQLTGVRGLLFFVLTDPEHGAELWRSDGTEAGTQLVKDIHPGFLGSTPSGLRVVGDTLLFSANDGETGHEPWKSDGTAEGTVRLADIAPGAQSSNPSGFTVAGSRIFFAADDGESGSELWAMPLSVLRQARTPRPVSFRP